MVKIGLFQWFQQQKKDRGWIPMRIMGGVRGGQFAGAPKVGPLISAPPFHAVTCLIPSLHK